MTGIYYTRYGICDEINADNEEQVMSDLLRELRREELETPDDEHTQVSVGNEHWSVTVQVSGLVTFDNMDLVEGLPSDLPENLYLRDIDDDRVKAIWRSIVCGDRESLLSHSWVASDDLPPYTADYYRRAA